MKHGLEFGHVGRLTVAGLAIQCCLATSCELITTVDRDSIGLTTSIGGSTSTSGGAYYTVGPSSGGAGGTVPTGGMPGSTQAQPETSDAGTCSQDGGPTGSAGDGGETSDLARSLLDYDSAPVVSADTQVALVADLNDFGIKVLQDLAPSNQNFAVSPVSGFLALTMTSDGAQGDTAAEMATVLYPDVPASDIQVATNQILQRVRGYVRAPTQTTDGEKKVSLNVANDVFAQKGLNIEQPFLDNLATNYNAGVELVDFSSNPDGACDLINNWVASETNCIISNLLPPGTLDKDTRLVLVNALYLYSSWKNAFNPKSTQSRTFHSVAGDGSAEFMYNELYLNFASGTGWQGVDIPYYGGSLVLTAILPNSGQFDAIKANLNAAWFSSFDASTHQTGLALILPKFKLAGSTVSWLSTLEHLGMNKLFNQRQCDLSGITQDVPLYVKDVLQQVYIDVSEQGTEATAATAVVLPRAVIEGAGVPMIIFDRPFLFFVREPKGPVLFAGQVVSLPVGK